MAKTNTAAARVDKDGATSTTANAVKKKAVKRKAVRAAKAPKLPKAVAGAVDAARSKKASAIVVLDLRTADGFTDYFVICTGQNARQIAAIADTIRDTLRTEYNERPALAEGADKSEWVLLDYFNFVVHVFSPECRAFYDLERLWGNAERFELDDPEGPGDRH